MATAIVSAARGEPVRSDVAMTGEITLSGLVLPVGGIREKALAARRYGIKTFILPEMNEQDLVGAARRSARADDVRSCADARGRAQGRAARRRASPTRPVALSRVPSVFFYISGHGFGHTVRQIAIINALGARAARDRPRRPHRGAAPAVRSDRARAHHLPRRAKRHRRRADRQRAARRAHDDRARGEFYRTLPERAADGSGHPARTRCPTGDFGCPSAGMRGRRRCGHSVGRRLELHVGLDLRGIRPGARPPRRSYCRPSAPPTREAAEGWRLPLHGGFATVPHVIDLPFVARHALRRSIGDDVTAELSLPVDRPLVLGSFGGYGVSGLRLWRAATAWTTSIVVMTAPAAEIASIDGPVHRVAEEDIYGRGLRYVDLVAAVDVVVTKPGYGIIADCVANQTAMLYTSRGRFVEYDVMVERDADDSCAASSSTWSRFSPGSGASALRQAAAASRRHRRASHRWGRGRGGPDRGETRRLLRDRRDHTKKRRTETNEEG